MNQKGKLNDLRQELDAVKPPKKPSQDTPLRKAATRVFFLIGLVGVGIMMWRLDITQVDWPNLVRHMPFWVPALLALWALIYAIHAATYRLILGEDGKSLHFWYLYKLTVTCFAINNVTPIGLAGGEPYRIMEMSPHVGAPKATASTLSFSLLYMLSHVLFGVTGCAVYFTLFVPSDDWARAAIFGVIGVAFAAFSALVLFGRRENLIQRLFARLAQLPWAGKYAEKFAREHAESLATVDREIHYFHGHKSRFYLTVLLEFVTRLMEAAEYYMIYWFLGQHIPYFHALFSLHLAALVGNALFIIPMQLGAREGGAVMALGWMGFPASLGVSASLLARIREIVFTVVGISALLFRGRARKKEG